MTNTNRQQGFIALTITLIILLLVISLSIMTGKVLVGEQRIAANEMRYREALANAEANLETGLSLIASAGVSAIPSLPTEVSAAESTIAVGPRNMPMLNFRATGNSIDGSAGQATVRVQVVIMPIVVGTPDSPLMLAAGMAVGGNFMVVANPNGGGPGVPLSIWTKKHVELTTGSGTTCGQQEWANGTCSSSPYSEPGRVEGDILDDDATFPPDLLQYVFGVKDDAAGMLTLEQRAKALLTNCDTLNTSSSGFYIVDGTCRPNGTVGSRTKPVVLLIRNSDLDMVANTQVFGIVFSYDSHPEVAPTYDLKMNGTATIWGSLIANYEVDNAKGTFNAVYDAATLSNIQNNNQDFVSLYKVPGSWRDW
ncbi:PilX N-terminal domain-containing pilus assembly protein [Pseudaeromonas pectinilytica]